MRVPLRARRTSEVRKKAVPERERRRTWCYHTLHDMPYRVSQCGLSMFCHTEGGRFQGREEVMKEGDVYPQNYLSDNASVTDPNSGGQTATSLMLSATARTFMAPYTSCREINRLRHTPTIVVDRTIISSRSIYPRRSGLRSSPARG